MLRRCLLSSAILLLAGPVRLAAQPAPAAPSPGRTALLVGRSDPAYRTELRAAIASVDPVVRTVAARVAGVRHQGDMIEPLRQAVASETDPIAAREQRLAIQRLERGVPPDAAVPETPPQVIRTFPLIGPGVLRSVMDAVGCKPSRRNAVGAARITFDASGAAVRSVVDPSALPASCKDVLSTFARLAVADHATSGVHEEYLLLSVTEDYVGCGDEPPPVPAVATEPGQTITRPRKIHDVKPEYPDRARQARLQGRVTIVSNVTSRGCINDARVTRGVDPDLDVAAMRAVIGWRFEPARVGGKAVPMLMTTVVSFNVQ